MSVSPKKSDKSKSKQKDKVKDKDKQKQKSVKGKQKQKDKDTKSKKSKDEKKNSSQIQIPKPLLLPPAPLILQINQHICNFHNQPNYSFCQTCQQLACQQCTIYGPHQSQIHKIVSVEESYRNRYLYLKELIYKDLLKKRDELTERIQILNNVVDELKYNKQIIQRTINIEFNEVLDRLKVAYGGKLAVLYNVMAELQKQLESLNNLGQQFFNLTNFSHNESAETNPKGLVPFLLKSKYLQQQAENLIAFPVNQQVNVHPYDLPRQVQQKKALLQKARLIDPAKQFKYEVIFSLIKANEDTANSLQSQFVSQANQQKSEWLKIVDQLKNQLAKFDKICHFCGVPLSKDSVNSICGRNMNRTDDLGYCKNTPARENLNTGFHYFDVSV